MKFALACGLALLSEVSALQLHSTYRPIKPPVELPKEKAREPDEDELNMMSTLESLKESESQLNIKMATPV